MRRYSFSVMETLVKEERSRPCHLAQTKTARERKCTELKRHYQRFAAEVQDFIGSREDSMIGLIVHFNGLYQFPR
jgi:excinuclease UvrABC nuclease subunit